MTFKDWLITWGLFLCLLIGAVGWGRLGLHLLSRILHDPRDSEECPVSASDEWYLSLTLGMGLLSWFTLFVGMAHLLYSVVAWGILVGGGGIGLLWKRLPGLKTNVGKDIAVGSDKLEQCLAALLALLGIGSLLYTLLVNALMPPYEWDEIAYHLALSKLYVSSHGIIYVPFIVHSNWPMNTEMLFSLGLLLGSDMLPHLVTWWMTLLTAWGLYLIGRRFLNPRVGWLAATLYLAVPLVIRLSGTGLIDVSLPFYGTAAIFSFAYYRRIRSSLWAGLSGLFCGLAAGSKLQGGGYPLIIGLLFFTCFLRVPRSGWRTLPSHLALFGGLGLLMVGPWYARSYMFTGNPVWPFLYNIFGGRNWDWLGDEYHMQSLQKIWTAELPISLHGIWLSFQYLFFKPSSLGGYPAGIGQVLLGLAALSVPLLRRAPRLIYELLLLTILYYAIWFLFVSHQIRFLFPILPALALMGAFAFYVLWDYLRWPVLRCVLAGVMLFLLSKDSPWIQPGQRNLAMSRLPVLADHLAREAFLNERVEVMPAFNYINSSLPSDAVVLLLPYENRGYYLNRRYIWGHPMMQRIIRFEEYTRPEELVGDLRNLGVTHVLDVPHWLYTGLRYWEHDRALMLAMESRCGEQLAIWGDVTLYRLQECRY